ncbi:MAG TPA: BON domain-containing protein [Vicinamibacterales bacterium]|nr:BON domain-containing protein [Vicinamibacterales bacterium]
MSVSKYLMTAVLVGLAFGGQACTDRAVNETKEKAGAALDATRAGADRAIDATKRAGDATADAAQRTAGTAKAMAGDVVQQGGTLASATGGVVADDWITTRVDAKVSDDTMLEGSDITVDTRDQVVTLWGTVPFPAARARAAAIARGTEGVSAVVNQLVVKEP